MLKFKFALASHAGRTWKLKVLVGEENGQER